MERVCFREGSCKSSEPYAVMLMWEEDRRCILKPWTKEECGKKTSCTSLFTSDYKGGLHSPIEKLMKGIRDDCRAISMEDLSQA